MKKRFIFLSALLFSSPSIYCQTWQSTSAPGGEVTAMIAGDSHRLIANPLISIKYTDNLGVSWHTALNNIAVQAFGRASNNFFAATFQGLYKSSDNGASWALLKSDGFNDLAAYDGSIWALEENMAILKTSDGISFDSLDYLQTLAIGFYRIAIDNAGTIIVAGDESLEKSIDGGLTFAPINYPFVGIRKISFDISGTLYVGESDGELFRSSDKGATWIQLNSTMPEYDDLVGLYCDSYGNILYGYNDGFS